MTEIIKDTTDQEQRIQYATFLELAETESDPSLQSDLLLAHRFAEHIQEFGGQALVVGGFARDMTLSIASGESHISKDIDIEVYKIEPEHLKELLQQFGKVDLVGQTFEVIKLTNPESGNALDFSIPRRDSKVGEGHKGFEITGDPDMSIQEAARRRDFTVNALALDPLTGELHDYFDGVSDAKDKILRATDNNLFGDDPLRALRAMQFSARFEMTIDPETAQLCRSFDLTELSNERIGEEWEKLLTKAEKPSIGLKLAKELGIIDQLHPELTVLEHTEQEADWHPEGNVWNHTMLVVDAAAKIARLEQLKNDDDNDEMLVVMLGALCHDLGKATTTEKMLKEGVMRITAHGHDIAGVEPTESLLKTLHVKKDTVKKVVSIVKAHMYHVGNSEPSEKQIRKLSIRLEPANIRLWDLVCRSDSNGRGEEEFRDVTSSNAIYRRAIELEVDKKPPENIVFGRDLLALNIGFEPGPKLGQTLRILYDAQLGGKFATAEDGVAYLKDNLQEILEQTS